MSKLTNGYYQNAKLSGYKLGQDKAGNPRPQIQFDIPQDGGWTSAWWDGNFNNDIGIEIALTTLQICGLKDPDDIARLSEGLPSGLLDSEKLYKVKVAIEGYDGRSFTKIKSVYENDSEPKGAKAMDEVDAKDKLKSLNLGAAFHKIKQEAGVKDAPVDDKPVEVPF